MPWSTQLRICPGTNSAFPNQICQFRNPDGKAASSRGFSSWFGVGLDWNASKGQ